MSTPTRQLGDLSLGGMAPTTRAQQLARDRQAGLRQQPITSGEPSSVVPSIERDVPISQPTRSATGNLIHGRSGLRYGVQGLSPASIPRATIGLSSAFEVERSRTYEDEDHCQYHAIQLNQPVSVRVFNPEHTEGVNKVSCGCEEYRQEQQKPGTPVCVHIYWLYDALNLAFRGLGPNQTHPITKDGVIKAIVDLYEEIQSDIDTLHQKLNQGSDEDSPNEMENDEDEITQTCLDMLSVMTKDLPEEFAENHEIETIPDSVTEFKDLVKPEDIERTLFGLLKHDETLRWRFQRVLTRDYCAVQFIRKLENRAQSVFKHLSDHVRNGRQSNPQVIARCAHGLRTIISQCKDYINDRAPLSKDTKCHATTVLVRILNEVCQFDRDIYDEITWRRTQPDPPQPYNRNLFVNLIGRPPPPGVAGNTDEEGEMFFFNAFDIFSPAEVEHCRSLLDHIVKYLEENEAPPAFIERLEKVIEDVKELELLQPSPPPRSPTSEEQQEQQGPRHSLPSSPATAEPRSQRRRLG